MQTVTLTLYEYDELSPEAKETARQWYVECWDRNDADQITRAIREHCSIEHGLESEGYEPGTLEAEDNEGQSLKIRWRLGHCQGDGVAFVGTFDLDALAAKQPAFRTLLRALRRLGAEVGFKIVHRGNYTHCHSMDIEVYVDASQRDGEPEARWRRREARLEDLENRVTDCLNGLLVDISQSAETAGYAEIEYQQSEEVVSESIRSNEYTFLESGKRYDA